MRAVGFGDLHADRHQRIEREFRVLQHQRQAPAAQRPHIRRIGGEEIDAGESEARRAELGAKRQQPQDGAAGERLARTGIAADAASLASTRREIASHVRSESAGNADDFMVELITGEILAAEWYRHAGAIAIEVEWKRGTAVLEVWDQGPKLDLSNHRDPLDEDATLLLRKFAKELQIENTPQGNHIRVALPAHKAAGPSKSRRLLEIAATLVGLRSNRRAKRFHGVIKDEDWAARG